MSPFSLRGKLAAARRVTIVDEPENMAKRLMIVVVGAGIGSLAGLLAAFLGAGNIALIGGAVVGAILPLLVLGAPGK